MHKFRYSIAFIQSLLLTTLITLIQPVSAQVVDISECRALEDAQARFACFENLVDEPEPQAPTAATSSASDSGQEVVNQPTPVRPPVTTNLPVLSIPRTAQPAPAPAAAPETAVSADEEVASFGTSSNPGNARIVQGEGDTTELIDTVAKIEEFMRSRWTITLESGQVWRQVQARRYNLKKGDSVRIYPTMWGSSYRMTAERLSGYIQVQRIE